PFVVRAVGTMTRSQSTLTVRSGGAKLGCWVYRRRRVEPTILSLIDAVERGESAAAEPLFAALYTELHRLAKRELARHGVPVSLGATTLLHEAYVNMAARSDESFPDRARFMVYAGRVMRGLIIDH